MCPARARMLGGTHSKISASCVRAVRRIIFTVLAAVAELERSTIRERVMAGQRAAKRRGVRFGRPTVEVDTALVGKLRTQGLSWRDIAEKTGEPKDTLIRHCKAQ
jgi:DNA invertase Pin-like site-specific DNA recombinase